MQGSVTRAGELVSVVIAVHTAQRPLSRAVRSCLSEALAGRVRIVVVCHNIPSASVSGDFADIPESTISFLELNDGSSSPAGPKNLGLAECRTPFVLVLDSDDFLEEGALEHWLEVLERTGADGVIAPLKLQSGAVIRTPRARLFRRHTLDSVKDQLAYATAPRGVWSTRLLESRGFRYTPGLRTAEDLDPGLRLWFSGARFEFPVGGPHYVLGEDAGDRVTSAVLPLAEEFRAVLALDDSWIASLTPKQRESMAIKLVRIHLFGALTRRGPQWAWPDDDRSAVVAFVDRARAISPSFDVPLTTAEVRLLTSVSDPRADDEIFQKALRDFSTAGYLEKLLSPSLVPNIRADSVLRHQLRLKAHSLLDRLPGIRVKH
ncbi:MAG: glycosyltransferase [Specibacter sp.]